MIKPKVISSYTIPVNKTLHLISFDNRTKPIGSFSFKVLYPGDIDVRENIIECCSRREVSQKMAEKIRNMIFNISRTPGYYFAEFKAGVDSRFMNDREKYVLRWSQQEVIQGFKILPGGIRKTLVDALDDPSIVKLDIWAPVKGRYIEASNFMIIMVEQNGQLTPLNGDQPDYVDSIKGDIKRYFSDENLNAFKATKRMMLLGKLFNDNTNLSKILPLINSGAGIMYQVLSDMDTISQMTLRLGPEAPYEYFYREIDSFKGRLSYIHEFDFQEERVDNLLDSIIIGKYKGIQLIDTLDAISSDLLDVLNNFVLGYDKQTGLYPPPAPYQKTN